MMEHHPDYLALRQNECSRYATQVNNPNLPPTPPNTTWNTQTSMEMPIWQFTPSALDTNPGIPLQQTFQYYPNESPIPPPYNNLNTQPHPSTVSISTHPSIPSPQLQHFPPDVRFTPIFESPVIQQQQQHQHQQQQQLQTQILNLPPAFEVKTEWNEDREDEESDNYSWVTSPDGPPKVENKHSHRRSKSLSEATQRNAKRAHTVVERNYRERLNDKIADLGLYLFETSSDSRSKPSKSLVMTRAKERLQQLESRNKSLEAEVAKLRQHIAILDHIVGPRVQVIDQFDPNMPQGTMQQGGLQQGVVV